MPEPEYDPSPRSLRRWVLGTVVALAVQSGVTLLGAVDPAQRAVSVGWSLCAALLMWCVFRSIPKSAVRPRRRAPEGRQRDGYALTQGLWAVGPVVFGGIMTRLLPGDPTGWMRNGVRLSAGLAAVAVIVLLRRWLARRRLSVR